MPLWHYSHFLIIEKTQKTDSFGGWQERRKNEEEKQKRKRKRKKKRGNGKRKRKRKGEEKESGGKFWSQLSSPNSSWVEGIFIQKSECKVESYIRIAVYLSLLITVLCWSWGDYTVLNSEG